MTHSRLYLQLILTLSLHILQFLIALLQGLQLFRHPAEEELTLSNVLNNVRKVTLTPPQILRPLSLQVVEASLGMDKTIFFAVDPSVGGTKLQVEWLNLTLHLPCIFY